MVGPESQNSFEVYGTKGSVAWNFEKMNELRVYIAAEHKHTGFTTVFAGDRFPPHGNFVPGSGNSIGFEDLICIEDHEFLQAVAAGRQYTPGFTEALAYVSVQDAVMRSWNSGHWEDVVSLREE
jgi:predicted dehydrogenase